MGQLPVAELIVWYLVFLFSTTFHEFSHALLAYKGGDPTAYEGGQVSLDPMPHIRRSPVGMVLVPLLSFLQLGWMIGWASTPYDPQWARRNPRKHAWMSLAGPLSNLLLAAIGVVLIRVLLAAGVFAVPSSVSFTRLVGVPAEHGPGSPVGALAMALSVLVNLNVLLGLFNLMPIPPLDGAGVVEGLAPKQTGTFYERLQQNAMFGLAGLLIAWYAFQPIALPALRAVWRLIYPGAFA